jgi:hypothetical protein
MLQRFPDKHVAFCVIRPAQALSHADRLRAALGVPVGAFCGGDFLYNFEEEFKKNKVVVFTAGLLMRLAKLGTYKLEWASLLVLHDAFSAVRNHPMNTLVREYYWKGPAAQAGADKPRVSIKKNRIYFLINIYYYYYFKRRRAGGDLHTQLLLSFSCSCFSSW